jgi:hypothetical protein
MDIIWGEILAKQPAEAKQLVQAKMAKQRPEAMEAAAAPAEAAVPAEVASAVFQGGRCWLRACKYGKHVLPELRPAVSYAYSTTSKAASRERTQRLLPQEYELLRPLLA